LFLKIRITHTDISLSNPDGLVCAVNAAFSPARWGLTFYKLCVSILVFKGGTCLRIWEVLRPELRRAEGAAKTIFE